MDFSRSAITLHRIKDPLLNPGLSATSREIHMAVEFISSKIPPWKAIQTRLKPVLQPRTPPRLNLDNLNQRKLGPGCYTLRTVQDSNLHKFSSLPRFSSNEKLRILVPNLEKVSSNTRLRGKQIFHKNLDITPHLPENKAKTLKSLSETRMNSINLAQKKKEALEKRFKNEVIEKITNKYKRIEKWSAAKYKIQAEKGWICLMVCVNIAFVLNKIRNVKRRFKSVFTVNSKLLYQVSRVIGRFKLILNKIRRHRSLKILEVMLLPLMNEKMNKMVLGFRINVVNTLERCLTKRMFKRLYASWRKKYIKVITGLNYITDMYRARLDSLYLYWDSIQTSYHTYSAKTLIPFQDSRRILNRHLLMKMKEFYILKSEYNKNVYHVHQSIRKSYTKTGIDIRKKGILASLNLGVMPILRIFNREEIIRLYLEEEQKLHIVDKKQESFSSLSVIKEYKSSRTIKLKSPRQSIR